MVLDFVSLDLRVDEVRILTMSFLIRWYFAILLPVYRTTEFVMRIYSMWVLGVGFSFDKLNQRVLRIEPRLVP